MFHPRKLASALALALGCAGVAHAAQSTFDKVVVFGDSLSDNGNIHSIEPGSQERFTTNPGKVAVELVAQRYGFTLAPSTDGGSDYAWGGARASTDLGPVLSMQTQVANYLTANGGHADAHALYTTWIGANDLFAAATDPANAQAIALSAAHAEVATIKQLHDAGARYVVVFNLPDVSKTPGIRGTAQASSAGLLGNLYNGVLNAGLGQIDTGIIPVNAYALLNQVIADPARYGFSNVTDRACTTSSSINCSTSTLAAPDAASSYLFADNVHPTTAAHAMLAQVVLSELAAPQQISLLGEAPLASSQAQTRALRNQMLADGQGAPTRFFANVDYAHQRFDASNSSPKTTSNNVNLTLGADVRANDHVSAGVALGIGNANADVSGGGGYKLQDVSGLGYLTFHRGGGYVGGYANFGQSNFSDVQRSFQVGAARVSESGKADGSHYGAGLTGGWWFDMGSLRTGPFANLDWQTIKVNGYAEGGSDATAMWFGRQQRKALIGTLGWRLQGHWQLHQAVLAPFIELAWNHDSKADQRMVTAGLNTLNGSFQMAGYAPDKSWATADIGVSATFDNITTWFGYSGRFADNSQKYNSLNLGFKFAF
jgi:outer membrane lipase/esterase